MKILALDTATEACSVALLLPQALLLRELPPGPGHSAHILGLIQALLAEAERSTAFRRRVETSCRRILAYKRRNLTSALPKIPSDAAISRLRLAVQKFAKDVAV